MKVLKVVCPLLILVVLATQVACNNQQQYEIKSMDKYEKSKESIVEAEQKNPLKFLSVKGEKKKNLLGQTVVKGKIFNSAKIVTYKDVDLKLSFYSRTGALLAEENDIIYENIQPGESKSFKSKIFAPKATDSVAIKIISAKY